MITAVYADGGVIQRNPSPLGGTWAYVYVGADDQQIAHDSGIVLPRQNLPLITNNLTEFVALVKALEALPAGWSGQVLSDSQVTLGRMFLGWRLSGIPSVLVRQYEAARARLDWANVRWTLLDGHPTKAQLAAGVGKRGNPVSAHNVFCDQACGRQSKAFLEKQQ